VLFVPGSRPERFAKALASGAEMVCVDLEDAVPAGAKEDARRAATEALAGSLPISIRINSVSTAEGMRDVLALRDARVLPTLIFVPMVQSAAEVGIVGSVLGIEDDRIVPLVESAQALRVAHEIGQAPRVCAMMFGGGDLAAELGIELSWEPLAVARGQFVLACAGAGVGAIDVPFIGLDDADGLEQETLRARALGFTGKAAIHPSQVSTIMRIFRPSASDVAEARRAIEAFRAAGGRAVKHEGRMLEAPVIKHYETLLARQEDDAHA